MWITAKERTENGEGEGLRMRWMQGGERKSIKKKWKEKFEDG